MYEGIMLRVGRALNAMWPNVGMKNESSRERWLKDILGKVPKNHRLLDAGAGTQRYGRYCEHLEYISQDFGEYDGRGDDVGLQPGEFDYGKLDIISDITSIPEPDSSFDAILCVEVLEHLPNPAEAIKEFSRLLRPNGELIVTAPFCSLTHFAPYHFSSGFNKYWYEHHLDVNNFKEFAITRNGNFFEYLSQELHRVTSVSKRYSESKPNLLEYISLLVLQRMLLRFSKKDSGSSELLCFGYHIHARKG